MTTKLDRLITELADIGEGQSTTIDADDWLDILTSTGWKTVQTRMSHVGKFSIDTESSLDSYTITKTEEVNDPTLLDRWTRSRTTSVHPQKQDNGSWVFVDDMFLASDFKDGGEAAAEALAEFINGQVTDNKADLAYAQGILWGIVVCKSHGNEHAALEIYNCISHSDLAEACRHSGVEQDIDALQWVSDLNGGK